MIVVQLATGDVLLLILQRYYFESESQRDLKDDVREISCCLSYKDTILKANHSSRYDHIHLYLAVAYPTKILFWKRITAYFTGLEFINSCCLSYKDTILKANHSKGKKVLLFDDAVAYPTKILFWKRITALYAYRFALFQLLLILQRYYFESESQLDPKYSFQFLAVAYPTKILFWKRITAISEFHLYANVLLLILQRYYFESESQPFLQLHFLDHRCCLSYKDTILKANHSYPAVCKVRSYAVAYPTKILFWKRITANHYQ